MMPENETREKAAARCRECHTVYSAWVPPDDSIRLIGRKDGVGVAHQRSN